MWFNTTCDSQFIAKSGQFFEATATAHDVTYNLRTYTQTGSIQEAQPANQVPVLVPNWISQEWQEIGLRNIIQYMLFDTRAFKNIYIVHISYNCSLGWWQPPQKKNSTDSSIFALFWKFSDLETILNRKILAWIKTEF
jgi:hypothetical protein